MLEHESKVRAAQITYHCERKAAELRQDPEFMASLPQVFVAHAEISRGPVLAISSYGLTTRMHSEVGVLVDPVFFETEYPITVTGQGMIHVAELIGGFIEDAMGADPRESLEPGGNYVVRGHLCRLRLEVKTLNEVLTTLADKAEDSIDKEKFLAVVFGMTRALYRNTDFPFAMLVATHIHFGDFTCEKMVNLIEKKAADHPWTH